MRNCDNCDSTLNFIRILHKNPPMLAVRASTSRSVQRIARTFATVVEASGVKVASVDHGQPNSAVTLLMKAGSRFQPKAGVAQALKNFAFKVSSPCSLVKIWLYLS